MSPNTKQAKELINDIIQIDRTGLHELVNPAMEFPNLDKQTHIAASKESINFGQGKSHYNTVDVSNEKETNKGSPQRDLQDYLRKKDRTKIEGDSEAISITPLPLIENTVGTKFIDQSFSEEGDDDDGRTSDLQQLTKLQDAITHVDKSDAIVSVKDSVTANFKFGKIVQEDTFHSKKQSMHQMTRT